MAAAANLMAGQLPGAAAVPGLGAAAAAVPGLSGLVPGAGVGAAAAGGGAAVGVVDAGVSAVPTESLMVSGMVTPQVLANQEEYEEVRREEGRGAGEHRRSRRVVGRGNAPSAGRQLQRVGTAAG
jgi:hypothetical protein